jgi:3-deoxy-D-manno-octulosonic acid kinase
MTSQSSPDDMAKQANIQQKTVNGHIILFDAAHFSDVTPHMFSGDYWQQKNAITGQAIGRGTTYFFQHEQHEYVLRHYRRGGLIGKILNDQYLYTGLEQSRAWQEFNLLQHMQTLGLACPKPIAARLIRRGCYYQADIISSKIEKAQDLYQVLLKSSVSTEAWQQIGQTIAEFHQQQIYHHDLNIHNIMLDNNQKAWLIDFDKCAVKTGEEWKKANIARLKRSFEKELALHNINWDASDWQNLITAYLNGKPS